MRSAAEARPTRSSVQPAPCRSRVVSRGQLAGMADKVRGWQDDVARQARDAGLDVLRLDLNDTKSDIALAEFAVERRLRKR